MLSFGLLTLFGCWFRISWCHLTPTPACHANQEEYAAVSEREIHAAPGADGGVCPVAHPRYASAKFQRCLRACVLRWGLFLRRNGVVAALNHIGAHGFGPQPLLLRTWF